MEEDQEHIKHGCKFCNKSFPCGRSLGGHMRSHVTNFSAESEKMKKLSSLNNGGGEETTGSEVGYGLRENPKKTWRLTNSSEEKETGLVAVLDKLCKECGRGFQSWKALFGHMKCHSDKEKVILDDDHDHQDDSWNKVVMNDCESDDDDDNEVNVLPKRRRRRSKRKRTRYMKTTTTTTSVTSSVSVSEIEHEYGYEYWGGFNSIGESSEQEEVAISLMMLSRDVSNWGGFNSIGESSETNLVSKIEGKRVISNDSEIGKFVKSSDKNSCEFGNSNGKNSEILVTESTKNDRFGESSYQSNSNSLHLEKTVSKIEGKRVISNGTEIGKLVTSSNKKSKFFDASKKSNSMKNSVHNASESEISKKSHKKGKFECTTCNKIFQSYQALGGHRASHKRNKGCFASKIESSENTNEFEESNELMKKNIENVEEEEHEELEAMELESQSERAMVEESLPEIRNFLDLNLPATTDEENNGNQHAEIYKPWWLVGNNHKQEGLVLW